MSICGLMLYDTLVVFFLFGASLLVASLSTAFKEAVGFFYIFRASVL